MSSCSPARSTLAACRTIVILATAALVLPSAHAAAQVQAGASAGEPEWL